MNQQDFARPLVLPALDVLAVETKAFSTSGKQSAEFRAGLRRAAEDGFYTFRHVGARTPPEWFRFCIAHKHPPVTVETKVKYATVRCLLSNLRPTCAAEIPGGDCRRVLTLLRTFIRKPKPKGAFYYANGGGVTVEGVPIEDSRECATVLVDLLCECAVWVPRRKEAAPCPPE